MNVEAVSGVLTRFGDWHKAYGESSFDHQSYYAGPYGRWAKALYYRRPWLGRLAVAPMVLSEAFVPQGRRLFHRPIRLPIADAHYAMGFTFLAESRRDPAHRLRAETFLKALVDSRCSGYQDYCWGYPFDWMTRNGVIVAGTPLITTTPYAYEAFLQVHHTIGDSPWRGILESIVRHAITDIKDIPISATASSCSYTPFDRGGVVNASAYRAFLLTSASVELGIAGLEERARRNLSYVLESQRQDGSWYYATDGVRTFIDHFHTCFVLKALVKIYALAPSPECLQAIHRGVDYYLANLFEDGLPRPFARRPRLTVYRRELYDYAECVNLCVLLRHIRSDARPVLRRVVEDLLARWIKPDGSFRSRELAVGWDNVPMHRWAQAQMFRSLALLVWQETRGARTGPPAVAGAVAS